MTLFHQLPCQGSEAECEEEEEEQGPQKLKEKRPVWWRGVSSLGSMGLVAGPMTEKERRTFGWERWEINATND